MVYCRDCGSITEGKLEHETFEPGYGIEYEVCSVCGSESVEHAVRCPICLEYHRDTGKDECEECRADVYNKYVEILKDEENLGANRDDVMELMSSVFEDFWNKYY